MTLLVAYASKYGSTQRIAERIAEALNASGVDAVAQSVKTVTNLSGYDAFVIGSAVFIGSWMKEAVTFATQHNDVLASRPVWLFSSGPLGTPTTDAAGHDVREGAQPKQLPELREMLKARDHHVFFGASDHTHFNLRDRLVYAMPAARQLLLDGDFRDWSEVETWAKDIAHALPPAPV
jgi:menaquinone-dependent protoporphyrinogen oxidase